MATPDAQIRDIDWEPSGLGGKAGAGGRDRSHLGINSARGGDAGGSMGLSQAAAAVAAAVAVVVVAVAVAVAIAIVTITTVTIVMVQWLRREEDTSLAHSAKARWSFGFWPTWRSTNHDFDSSTNGTHVGAV